MTLETAQFILCVTIGLCYIAVAVGILYLVFHKKDKK